MVNKNNYVTNNDGYVAMITFGGSVYCPSHGHFSMQEFYLPATQEQAEKCQAEIDASDYYYNHEMGCVVKNDFDVVEWKKNKKDCDEFKRKTMEELTDVCFVGGRSVGGFLGDLDIQVKQFSTHDNDSIR